MTTCIAFIVIVIFVSTDIQTLADVFMGTGATAQDKERWVIPFFVVF